MAPPSLISTQRSIVWLGVLNSVSWFSLAVFGFITTTVIYRFSGAEVFGVWATIAALRTAALWLDGGLALGVVRDAALLSTEGEGAIPRIQAGQFAYRALGALALLVALVASPFPALLLHLSGHSARDAQLLTLLFGVDAALTLAGSPLAAIFRGQQRFEFLAIGSISHLGLGVALLVAGLQVAGLPGAALGLVIARAMILGGYAIGVRAGDPALLRARPTRSAFTSLLRFAVPLWLSGFGALVGQTTDIPIIGWLFGPRAAGDFAVGAVVPSVLAGALWMLIDTAYPRLVTTRLTIAPLRLVTFTGSLLGALGLLVLALSTRPLLRVWLSEDPTLSAQVMTIYSVTWLLHMPAHVLSLAAIAKNKHSILMPLVLIESVANLLLSVALAILIGPVGPALGTLLTLAVSNLAVVPWLLLPRIRFPTAHFIRATVAGLSFGVLLALLVVNVAALVTQGDLARLVVSAVLPILGTIAGAIIWIRDQDLVYRSLTLLLDGGLFQGLRRGRSGVR